MNIHEVNGASSPRLHVPLPLQAHGSDYPVCVLSKRFFLPSQNPFLSIRAETDTRPSGMNMQETFFSFLADTGACVEGHDVLRYFNAPSI